MTVVVFGGTGGLGRPVVEHLRQAGWQVVAVGRQVDVRDEAQVKAFVDAQPDLYAVVQLAGGFLGGRPVEDTPGAWFEDLWRLNCLGTVHAFRAALPRLKAAGKGRLVAVGALAAHRHVAGLSAYNASKAALEAFVCTLAEELKGSGVTANVLLPTTIDTDRNRTASPPGSSAHWVRPEALAALVAYLLSDSGGDVQGAAIPVRGGL